jgi:ATP-NAD kinase C-terminal domain/ATP-NAD kinase N-terminal domain
VPALHLHPHPLPSALAPQVEVEEGGLKCLGGRLATWRVRASAAPTALIECPAPLAACIDLVATLGGDGTLLWACKALAAAPVPPVVPFAMGSLGFMTPFPAESIPHVLQARAAPRAARWLADSLPVVLHCSGAQGATPRALRILTAAAARPSLADTSVVVCWPVCSRDEALQHCIASFGFARTTGTSRSAVQAMCKGDVQMLLRHRLECSVLRAAGNTAANATAAPVDTAPESHFVLNEVSLHRGSSPSLTNVEVYCDNAFVTNVQGDGLVIATPTGSTAYSLAAGGSMARALPAYWPPCSDDAVQTSLLTETSGSRDPGRGQSVTLLV